MKKIIHVLLLFISFSTLKAQDNPLVIGRTSEYMFVGMNDRENIDTLMRFYCNAEIQTSLLVDSNNIRFVVKLPLHFQYYSFTYKEGRWVKNLTSGQIAGNVLLRSMRTPDTFDHQPIEGSIKIVEDDVIKYKTKVKDVTVYAADIKAKNEAWIKEVEDYMREKERKE